MMDEQDTSIRSLSERIDALKAENAALATERDFLRRVIDSIPDIVFVKDATGKYVLNNRAHLSFLGESDPESVKSKAENDYASDELLAEHIRQDQLVLSGAAPAFAVEEPVVDAVGDHIWHLTSKAMLTGPSGEISGLVGVSRDITDTKRRVTELELSITAAEHAAHAKSEFLANMSHEIRTPMNGIIGMTDLALDTELTFEQREYLEMVKLSADSLLSLLNDILDFSKIEAGKLDIDHAEFQLREQFGDTIAGLALRAQAKQLELAMHISPDVPENLVGDPRRLRQVLVNLVGNAIKFTNVGEVIVDVSVSQRDDDNVLLHVAIADTGIGIARENHERIFDAFAQIDSAANRRYGGTGLGLSISSQLVRLMGGEIWVESELGGGSKFHFTVSLQAGSPSQRHPIRDGVDLRGISVLVVDDNATNRHILHEMLSSWGMRPQEAANASEALLAMGRAIEIGEPFAVVLLDSLMPDVDGFALVRQIRDHPEMTSVTMMMLSSADRSGDAARCRQMGISSYLSKPIKQSTLFDAIVSAIATSSWGQFPASDEIPKTNTESPRPLRLLLAEDNAVNQRLAARILEKRGHVVTVANNGVEAIEWIGKAKFDLVLMDVQMPEMDGLEATAAIREIEKETGEHIPIVALTAHAMKGDRERCLNAGMDFYVSKPIQPQELIEVVDSLTSTYEDVKPSEAGQADASVFDLEQALDHVEGDQELLLELIELFFEQSPALMAEIQAAIEQADPVQITKSAHSLKGSASSFGANSAVDAAFRVEMIGRDGNLQDVDKAFEQLEREILTLTSALAAYRQDVLV